MSGPRLLAAVTAAALSVPALAAEPKPHPLINAYPGATISAREDHDFDEYSFLAGKIPSGGPDKTVKVAGRLTRLTYLDPNGRSVAEKFQNYAAAFKKAAFKELFSCKGPECGERGPIKWMGYVPYSDESRYLLVKLARKAGDVYVGMQVAPYETSFVIAEAKAMETDLVTISADAMKSGLDSDGHVAVYGITFDTGQAELKPSSAAPIAELVKLLKSQPALKILVVGHTDNVGDMDMNIDLSRRRAAAVVKELTGKHGIAEARLRPGGVGSQCPVATNRNDQGRAQNRRVDLVEQ